MTLAYVFAAQSVQLALPAIAYLPATQSPHATDALAPVVAKNFPAAQDAHADVPGALAYLPARQDVQLAAALEAENVPATQSVHTELPAIAYLPAIQSTHATATLAPVLAKYFPAAQDVHADIPGALAYLPATQFPHATDALAPALAEDVPAAQAVHVEPAIEYPPAAQGVHAVKTVLPAGDDDPAGQFVHVAPPPYVPAAHEMHTSVFEVLVLNFPAAHALHNAPSYPGKHIHAVRGTGLEVAPVGQLKHTDDASPCEIFPTSHSTQAELPAAEYEPAAQF